MGDEWTGQIWTLFTYYLYKNLIVVWSPDHSWVNSKLESAMMMISNICKESNFFRIRLQYDKNTLSKVKMTDSIKWSSMRSFFFSEIISDKLEHVEFSLWRTQTCPEFYIVGLPCIQLSWDRPFKLSDWENWPNLFSGN